MKEQVKKSKESTEQLVGDVNQIDDKVEVLKANQML